MKAHDDDTRTGGVMRPALDVDAMNLLKTDPEAYFAQRPSSRWRDLHRGAEHAPGPTDVDATVGSCAVGIVMLIAGLVIGVCVGIPIGALIVSLAR